MTHPLNLWCVPAFLHASAYFRCLFFTHKRYFIADPTTKQHLNYRFFIFIAM